MTPPPVSSTPLSVGGSGGFELLVPAELESTEADNPVLLLLLLLLLATASLWRAQPVDNLR